MINIINKNIEQLVYTLIFLLILNYFFSSLEINYEILKNQFNINKFYIFDIYNLRKISLYLISLISLIIYFFLILKSRGKKFYFLVIIPLVGVMSSLNFLEKGNYHSFLSNSFIPLCIVSIYYGVSYISISLNKFKIICYFLGILCLIITFLFYSFFNLDKFQNFEHLFYWQILSEKNAGIFSLIFKKIFHVSGILNPLFMAAIISITLNTIYMFKIKKFDLILFLITILNIEFIFISKTFYLKFSALLLLFIFLILYIKKNFFLFKKNTLIFYLFFIFLTPFLFNQQSTSLLKNLLVQFDTFKNEKIYDVKKQKCEIILPSGEIKSDNFLDYEFSKKYKEIFEFEKCYNNLYPLDNNLFLLSSFAQRSSMIEDYFKTVTIKSFFLGSDNLNKPFFFKNNKKIYINGFTHNSYLNIFWRYGFIMCLLIFLFLINEMILNKKNNYFTIAIIIVTFTQIFDDYLLGNRFEVSALLWFCLAILNNNKENFKYNYKKSS